MQEPEIFEQPVAKQDVEAQSPGEDNHTYTTVSGYHTNTAEDSSLDDYHDFVYPEGGLPTFYCSSSVVANGGAFSSIGLHRCVRLDIKAPPYSGQMCLAPPGSRVCRCGYVHCGLVF